MAFTLIFLLKKKSEQLCICKNYSHFFSKNTCELDIVLSRTVKILTTNERVKLRMFEQLGQDKYFFFLFLKKKTICCCTH